MTLVVAASTVLHSILNKADGTEQSPGSLYATQIYHHPLLANGFILSRRGSQEGRRQGLEMLSLDSCLFIPSSVYSQRPKQRDIFILGSSQFEHSEINLESLLKQWKRKASPRGVGGDANREQMERAEKHQQPVMASLDMTHANVIMRIIITIVHCDALYVRHNAHIVHCDALGYIFFQLKWLICVGLYF